MPRKLLFGNQADDGFPVNFILQGLAYVIAATTGEKIKGKRVLGSYIDLIKSFSNNQITDDMKISIHIPNRGTCLTISNAKYAALVGYVNDEFNKKLLTTISPYKFKVRNPNYKECVKLND